MAALASLATLLSLLLLSLSLPILTAAAAVPVSCSFTISFPNGSYPRVGELVSGTFTYDPTPVAGYANFPTGRVITSVQGTRTLFQHASATNATVITTVYTILSDFADAAGVEETYYAPSGYGMVYDELFYPECSVPEHLDNDGVILNTTSNGGRNYTYVNIFGGTDPTLSANITDLAGADDAQYGHGGAFTSLVCRGVDLLAMCAAAAAPGRLRWCRTRR